MANRKNQKQHKLVNKANKKKNKMKKKNRGGDQKKPDPSFTLPTFFRPTITESTEAL